MRKISAMILFVFLVFAFSVSTFAYSDVLIDDSAHLFTDSEKSEIDSVVYSFAVQNDFSVAVVTTDNALGKSSMEFADDYYDSLIFTGGWSEDGMVFLIDMDNREIYVSCSGVCIDEYSDYELDLLIDSGFESVSNGEYANCIISMVLTAEKLAYESDNYFYEDEIITGEDYYYADGYYTDQQNGDFKLSHIFIYAIIGLAVGGISVFAVRNQYKNMGKGDEFNADDISLELTASNDNIVSRNVITTRVPRNNNHNNRSGGGGGVSVHRSSGGVRHSGAGRKF